MTSKWFILMINNWYDNHCIPALTAFVLGIRVRASATLLPRPGRWMMLKSYCSIPEIVAQQIVHFNYIQGIQYALHSCTCRFGSWYSNLRLTPSASLLPRPGRWMIWKLYCSIPGYVKASHTISQANIS